MAGEIGAERGDGDGGEEGHGGLGLWEGFRVLAGLY